MDLQQALDEAGLAPTGVEVTSLFTMKSSLTRLEDKQGKQYILKRIPPTYFKLCSEEAYFQGLSYFMGHLRPHIPLVHYNQENGVIQVRDGYILYPFVEGNLFSGSLKEVKSIAKVHAKMNKVLATMDQNKVDFIKSNCFLRQDHPQVLLKEAKEKVQNILTETTKAFVNILPLLEQYVDCADYGSITRQVTHKDIFPGNVIFKNNEVVSIIDPDEMMYIPRARDVMYAMWGFATRRPPRKGVFLPDMERVKTYFTEYMQHDPLTDEEIKLLPSIAIRIWVEDVLHFTLSSSLDDQALPDMQRKIRHLQHAIEVKDDYKL